MFQFLFSLRKLKRRRVANGIDYQNLEKREVLTSLIGSQGVDGAPDSALAKIHLNPTTKVLYIHAGIQNPNLPGLASDVSVSLDRNSGKVVVSQIDGAAGMFRDIPGFSPQAFLVDSQRFDAGSVEQIIYKGTEGNDRFQNRTQIDSRIAGRGGDDYLVGGGGNDRVIGGDGNDQLFGGRNDDVLIGGNGDDRLAEDRVNDTGNDRLIGGNGNDRMAGGAGNDFLMGGAGNDTLGLPVGQVDEIGITDESKDFEPGNDRLFGNAGDDAIYGGTGSDQIFGGAGNDILHGGMLLLDDLSNFEDGVEDRIAGGMGDDIIVAGSAAIRAFGGAGNDHITGSIGNDRLIGHAGDDVVLGLAGSDFISGGIGNDLLSGDDGSDRIVGGAGEDELHGGEGADKIFAALGSLDGIAALGRDQIFGDARLDFILRDAIDQFHDEDNRRSLKT